MVKSPACINMSAAGSASKSSLENRLWVSETAKIEISFFM